MRALWIVAAATFAAVGTGAAAPRASAPPGARKASFESEGLIVKAREGSGCLPSGNGAGVCFDAPYDPAPTRGRLPVGVGGTLRVLVGAPAQRVDVALFRNTRSGGGRLIGSRRARRVGSSGRTWQVRLPRAVARTDVVYATVRYSYGDDSFGARVRLDGCGG